jgi:hypothetical protein
MLWVAYLDGGSEGAARIGRRLPSQARGTRRQRRFHPRRAARVAVAVTAPSPVSGARRRGRDGSIPVERRAAQGPRRLHPQRTSSGRDESIPGERQAAQRDDSIRRARFLFLSERVRFSL